MRKILIIALAGMLAAAATQTSSHAAQTFDGLWATSKKDCPEHDGPDSKTLIDLDNVINGKPAPLVDRYENHCRVDSKTPAGDGLVLQTTCFEFWDAYTKGENGEKVTIKLSPGPKGTIRIDGKPYLLCKRKSDLPKMPCRWSSRHTAAERRRPLTHNATESVRLLSVARVHSCGAAC